MTVIAGVQNTCQVPMPVIRSIAPSVGPINGGTVVTVTRKMQPKHQISFAFVLISEFDKGNNEDINLIDPFSRHQTPSTSATNFVGIDANFVWYTY
jgi:hypothetical protein